LVNYLKQKINAAQTSSSVSLLMFVISHTSLLDIRQILKYRLCNMKLGNKSWPTKIGIQIWSCVAPINVFGLCLSCCYNLH